MSASYKTVGWNRFKKRYDLFLALGVVIFLIVFIRITLTLNPSAFPPVVLMRAFGTAAILLLHLILVIGPLARLNTRWLPILYNRRHLGVCMFLLALLHGVAAMLYHIGADVNPILSVFRTDAGLSIAEFPFQAFGFMALLIFFMMAATSHDFWLANLTAPVWKTLHMLVYVAYAFVMIHVVFGVLQAEKSPVYVALYAIGFVTVSGLHLIAGNREKKRDRPLEALPTDDGFVEVCAVEDIPENEAHGCVLSGEKIAVVRYEGKISVISGVCQHQNGPLAEGRFTKGCLTCPWHGYQYHPDTGESPPPFTEKIPTFNVRVHEGKVFVHPKPNPAGTCVEPAILN
jgi:sulfoxide reductase heme-binding subunit YedZ